MAKRGTKKIIYYADLFPGEDVPLNEEFSKIIIDLEKKLQMPVWLLVQKVTKTSSPRYNEINEYVWKLFVGADSEFNKGEDIALVINSPGGLAKQAYQIARLLNQKCNRFYAIIPYYAKSAATLLSLGAEKIIMSRHAELGPLDAQTTDYEREKVISALDEVQALERLRAFGLESFDETMFMVIQRTGKKIETTLPYVLQFIANIMNPLMDKIDVVEYNQMSRILKVAEEYAYRLLVSRKSREEAKRISSYLVEGYTEHGFFIAREEGMAIGLDISQPDEELDELLDRIYHIINRTPLTAIGKVSCKEVEDDAGKE